MSTNKIVLNGDRDDVELLINNYLNLINDYKSIILQFMYYKKNGTNTCNLAQNLLISDTSWNQTTSQQNAVPQELLIENRVLKQQVLELQQEFNKFKQDSVLNYNKLHQDYLNLVTNVSVDQVVPKCPMDDLSVQLVLAQNELKTKSELNSLAFTEIERVKSNEHELRQQFEQEKLARESLKRQLYDSEMKLKLVEDKNKNLLDRLKQKDNEIETLNTKCLKFDYFESKNMELEETINNLKQEIDELTMYTSDASRQSLDLAHFKPSSYYYTNNMNKSRSVGAITDINRHEHQVTKDRRLIVSSSENVQYFLKSLSEQMSELQNQVYEHTRDSSTWTYRLGFSCDNCDMKWEIEHQVMNIQEACNIPEDFFDASIIRPLPKCDCYLQQNKR